MYGVFAYQVIQAVTFWIVYHPIGAHLSFERGHSSLIHPEKVAKNCQVHETPPKLVI